MQQLLILKGMIKTELKRNILRSQRAYELYKENRKFLCALRIYKSNKRIYQLLEKLLCTLDEEIKNDVINYIFHLEDWFEQFECERELKKPKLADDFVFERYEFSIPYPIDFLKNII